MKANFWKGVSFLMEWYITTWIPRVISCYLPSIFNIRFSFYTICQDKRWTVNSLLSTEFTICRNMNDFNKEHLKITNYNSYFKHFKLINNYQWLLFVIYTYFENKIAFLIYECILATVAPTVNFEITPLTIPCSII